MQYIVNGGYLLYMNEVRDTERVYTTCMIIGITVPLISLVLGSISDVLESIFDGIFNLFDGLHLDFRVEIGDASICLIPISVQSICAGLLIFGGAGRLVYNGDNLLLTNVVSIGGGYIAAVAIQTLIKRLKNVEHTTYSQEELLLFDATVVNKIIAGGYGSISVKTYNGIASSYPAKAENPKEEIRQDTVVSIVRFDKNTAIVKVKDISVKYEE